MWRKSVEVEMAKELQGLRKGSRMTDGMLMLRQLVDKRLEVSGQMALGFVGLEKTDDTIPREMVMVTMRGMGVLEAEVRLVEGMDEGMKGSVFVGPRMSEKFSMNIGLWQGNALSPLIFIVVIKPVSRKVSLWGHMGEDAVGR